MGTLMLCCALWLALDEIHIAGYLKEAIVWALGISLLVPSLIHWLEQISSLKACFSSISVCNLFREQNILVN